MKPAHRCYRVFKNLRVNSAFLVNYFKKRMYQKPDIKIREFKHYAKEELRIHVTMSKCKRARKLLIKEMNEGFKVEYVAILAYATEIERSNAAFVYGV